MEKYHIGTRLRGFSKNFLKEKRKLLPNPKEINYVPHITFIRPFYALNEEELVRIFKGTCENFEKPMMFRIKNFQSFDLKRSKEKTFYAKIESDENLDLLIDSLEKNLEGKINYESERPSKKRTLHATLITGTPEIFEDFFNEEILIDQYLLRSCIVKGKGEDKKILFEYDFFLNSLLKREEALDKKIFKETIKAFTNKTGLIPTKKGFQSSSGRSAKKL